MYEEGKEIIDATVKSNELTGGRLGKVSIFHFCVKKVGKSKDIGNSWQANSVSKT